MFEEGKLVKHVGISLLSRVQREDPLDNRKVVVKPICGGYTMSVRKDKLEQLGK